ncbi:MAG: GNAT family N-acetyltransferase, partial [Rhodothermales bacterium]|nr:GNAT family N-acetyltransferase [Rhodothermales bacterium]
IFNYMWRYTYNLRALYETPTLPEDAPGGAGRGAVAELLEEARAEGRTLLTEHESKLVLAHYGIPTVETQVATDVAAAVAAADAIGYPVVLKLHSRAITHKMDVGGVRLNLADAGAVRAAFDAIRDGVRKIGREDAFDGVTVQPMVRLDGYELIIGSSIDAQFGPVLLFGSGGSLVEVYRDRALGLPPLNTTLARRMMEQTRIYEALHGVRGRPPVDLDALEQLLVRFSHLVVEQRAIREVEINPLLASHERLLALDARVVLHDPATPPEDLPALAIRPYPRRYVGAFTMRDGTEVTIRPIRPEDEPLVVAFHEKLSERSVYLRYAGLLQFSQRVAHERLARICFIDYNREMALVAECDGTDGPEILGIGRLTQRPGLGEAEFAMLVRDDVQGQGLGTELLRRLIRVGEEEGLDRITADILVQNRAMQQVVRRLGFDLVRSDDPADAMIRAVKALGSGSGG